MNDRPSHAAGDGERSPSSRPEVTLEGVEIDTEACMMFETLRVVVEEEPHRADIHTFGKFGRETVETMLSVVSDPGSELGPGSALAVFELMKYLGADASCGALALRALERHLESHESERYEELRTVAGRYRCGAPSAIVPGGFGEDADRDLRLEGVMALGWRGRETKERKSCTSAG
jgi:hypothetical protein